MRRPESEAFLQSVRCRDVICSVAWRFARSPSHPRPRRQRHPARNIPRLFAALRHIVRAASSTVLPLDAPSLRGVPGAIGICVRSRCVARGNRVSGARLPGDGSFRRRVSARVRRVRDVHRGEAAASEQGSCGVAEEDHRLLVDVRLSITDALVLFLPRRAFGLPAGPGAAGAVRDVRVRDGAPGVTILWVCLPGGCASGLRVLARARRTRGGLRGRPRRSEAGCRGFAAAT